MPEHNPEDRVRIRNIVELEEDDIQTFKRIRTHKETITGPEGMPVTRERQHDEPFDWNFKDGFFFAWGGQYYWIKTGETKTYYRFLAEHAADTMATYLITREYLATKTVDSDGVPHYKSNILQNAAKREELMNKIIVGVEEWANPDNSDFDQKLARQFGGNFEQEVAPKINTADFMLNEVDQDNRPVKKVERVQVAPSSDAELQKTREEADLYEIVYTEKDTKEAIKSRILKAMA